jgi:DNA primase
MSRPSPITAARGRHPLAEVAARTGIDPIRTAGSVTVRCPLPSHGHPDRTPSLRLHLDQGIFSCFGCGARGDVVEWVRQTEGVDWRQAIRILDSGRPLTNAWAGQAPTAREGPQHARTGATAGLRSAGQAEVPDLDRTPPERVHAAVDAAWGYYTYPPLRYRGADYLRERGIAVRVLEAYTGRPEVGHTPAKADALVTSLRSKGFSDDELVDAGLAHRLLSGGPISDFYRQRVLIPVRDDQGRIAGFIGRNIGDQGRFAKYKNPPRTRAYDKSVNLYQPLPAPADRRGQVVVVEGTLDAMAIAIAAIRSGQADRFCPLTQSGRELSAMQLARVIGMHPGTPVLGFDGDSAGRDSAYRHSLAAALQGKAVAVTVLPGDHDPASWLAERGDEGLFAWMRDGAQRREHVEPMPVGAATFASRYVEKAIGRAGRSATPTGPDPVLATEVMGL